MFFNIIMKFLVDRSDMPLFKYVQLDYLNVYIFFYKV